MTKHYTPAEAEELLEDAECPRCVGTGSVGGEQITRDHFPTQVSDCESCGGSGSQNPLFGVARQFIEQARELERLREQAQWRPIESAPNDLRPVIACVIKQGDLGLEKWAEVIFFDEGRPVSFSGSTTFDHGEKCIAWADIPALPEPPK